MTRNNHLCRLLNSVYRQLRFRLDRVIREAKSTRRIVGVVRQSGLERALWILTYIEETLGGYESYKCKLPVDRCKHPLPWYTYPAIEFLQQYDFSTSDVWEFGSGNGSKFWAVRARTVTSLESDPQWYKRGIQELSSNQILLLRPEEEKYVNAIHELNKMYDVIVIDGKYRYNCAVEALKRIKNGGMIILDNSDWFPNTAKLFRQAGFIQIDFIGPGPVNSYAWCTSIFFRGEFKFRRRSESSGTKVLGGITQVSDEDRLL